jgi:hypothetical protein
MRGVAGAAFLVLALAMAAPAVALAQDDRPCQIVGVKDAGLLLICGDRLTGYLLTLEDVRRQVGNEVQGRFVFYCMLAPMMRRRAQCRRLLHRSGALAQQRQG